MSGLDVQSAFAEAMQKAGLVYIFEMAAAQKLMQSKTGLTYNVTERVNVFAQLFSLESACEKLIAARRHKSHKIIRRRNSHILFAPYVPFCGHIPSKRIAGTRRKKAKMAGIMIWT
jgi:hypothetical protein